MRTDTGPLRLLLLAGAAAVPALMIGGWPALRLLEANTRYLGTDLTAASLVFAVALGVALVVFLLGWWQQRSLWTSLGFWALLLTGFIWPLLQMLRGGAYGPVWWAAAGLAAVAGGLGMARSPSLARASLPAAGGLGLVFLAWFGVDAVRFVMEPAGHAGDPADRRARAVAMAERRQPDERGLRPDIYHLVLDELQTDLLRAVLDDHGRQRLSSFRFYPQATTPFGRTELALAALMSGVSYDYVSDPSAYIMEAFHGDRSLLARLKGLGYWTVGYLHQVYPRGAPTPFDETYFHPDVAGLPPTVRRDRLLFSLWLYGSAPGPVARRLLPSHTLEQLDLQALLSDEAPVQSLRSFERLTEVEAGRRRASDGPRYVFAHLILPHFPAVLDAGCVYHPGRQTRMIEQAACTVETLAEFVEALRAGNRFRDALIVVHADHGARHTIRDGELVRAGGGFYGLEWSRGRSRVALLVKPPGADEGMPLVVDDRPADLYDVYPTILEALGVDADPSFEGHSLLAPPGPERARYYHFYTKGTQTLIDGSLHRYRIHGSDISFDREIP